MKKLVLLTIVIVLGATLTDFVDSAIGIKFIAVPFWVRIAHKVIYLLWGAIIASVVGKKI